MNVKNLTPFPFGTKVTSRRPPQPEMTCVVRACYVIVPGKPLELPEGLPVLAQGPLSADTYHDDDAERAGECLYPGDFADWKPNAEVMLRGRCHTPGGEPLRECPVRFSVGSWSKIVRVIGRRFWSDDNPGAVMSEIAPFTEMPVSYAHAFGGEGYAQNPAGKGFSGRELPNVEHAGNVIRKRRDDHGPAGFGPINPAWPQRGGKMGKKYGQRYQKERAPYYAADFDWTYFRCAPADQQIQGVLRGDERLLLQNLHPHAPVIETSLPGLRIRAFVKDKKQRFREVGMSLDTLFADMDECKLYLTWRGLDAIETDDMNDVQTVLVASEKLDEPRLPEAQYRALLEEFEADPLELKERVPAEMREQFEMVQAAGGKKKPPPVDEEPAPDPVTGALKAMLNALPFAFPGAKDLEKQTALAVASALEKAPPEADMPAKIAQMADAMRASGTSPRSTAAVPLRPGGPPPAWAAKAHQKALADAEQAKQALAAQKLPKEAAPAVEQSMQEIDARVDMLKNEPFFANLQNRPPPVEPGPEKDLTAQDYEDRDLHGEDLHGAILRDANLTGANLAGANLRGAVLDGAVLVDANLEGADLTGADLTLANCSGVRAKGAILRDATLSRAFFEKADLSGAVLAGAKGESTFLPEADLSGADGKGLSLTEAFAQKAILKDADLSGASFVRCHFLEVDARNANLRRAMLARTSFAQSNLAQATLVEARGEQTVWMNATLDHADFTRAVLPRAEFMAASAEQTCFRRSILKHSHCYRASFPGADFTESNLFSVDFSKCNLSQARFRGANLYDAKLLQAAGKDCDFSGANLKRVVGAAL